MHFLNYFRQKNELILVLACANCFETEGLLVNKNITVLSLIELELELDCYNNVLFIEDCICQQKNTEMAVLGHKNCRIMKDAIINQKQLKNTSTLTKKIVKTVSRRPNADNLILKSEHIVEQRIFEQIAFIKRLPVH